MNIFVAGASGAIGRPLIAELIQKDHKVTGMTRSNAGAKALKELGADVAQVSAFDVDALEESLRTSNAEIVIDELTSLPRHPRDMPSAAAGDRKLRIEGGGNLFRAAQKCGVRRYIQQASGFFLQPGSGLADESEGMAVNASAGVAAGAQTYAELEKRILNGGSMEGVAMRYGFFYGPGTWYCPEGTSADQVRNQEIPLIGDGQGVWSWVHIDDAASATVAAISAPAGIYHVVDDSPLPMRDWLPAFSKFVGAPPPQHISEADALAAAGPDAVYYQTKLRGASNAKAKKILGFKPRRLEWLNS
jgi:nucleoside-diphosphate-sugar epimerase